MESITLESFNWDTRHGYLVTFEGEHAENWALAFIDGRSTTHAFHEVEETPVDRKYQRLLKRLYPTCGHGLSALLCYGPGHDPPDNW